MRMVGLLLGQNPACGIHGGRAITRCSPPTTRSPSSRSAAGAGRTRRAPVRRGQLLVRRAGLLEDLIRDPRAVKRSRSGAERFGQAKIARLVQRFYDVNEGPCCSTAPTCETFAHRARRSIGIVFEGHGLSRERARPTSRSPSPTPRWIGVRAGRCAFRGRRRVHRDMARRLRDGSRPARLHALRAGSAAHLDRARGALRSSGC